MKLLLFFLLLNTITYSELYKSILFMQKVYDIIIFVEEKFIEINVEKEILWNMILIMK